MEVELRRAGGVLVVRPLGRWLDAQATPDLQRRVAAELEKGERQVVVDLGGVEHVDSAGLGALIGLQRRLPAGGRLVLAGCRPPVRELLRRSRLEPVLPSYPTEEEAIASFVEAG